MATIQLPQWVRRLKIIGGRPSDLVGCGLHLILEASLRAGAGRRRGYGRLQLSVQCPERLLGGFTVRLGIARSAVMGTDMEFVDAMEAKIGGRLHPAVRRPELMAEAEYYRFMTLAHGTAHLALNRIFPNDDRIDATRLKDIGNTVFSSAGMPTAPPRQPGSSLHRAPTWNSSLDELVVAAYRTLTRHDDDDTALTKSDLDALIILGAVCRALPHVGTCRFCFRWSLPCFDLCKLHSLAQEAGGTRAERQARYRKGQRLCKACRGNLIQMKLIDSDRDAPLFVSRLLWSAPFPAEQRLGEHLHKQLVDEPILAALIGAGVRVPPAGSVEGVLRQRLDPMQWIPRHWKWFLPCASLWFCVDALNSHPDTRRRPKTDARISSALAFARATPGTSGAKIARAVGVEPSTVSQWLRRRPSDPQVELLRQALVRTDV